MAASFSNPRGTIGPPAQGREILAQYLPGTGATYATGGLTFDASSLSGAKAPLFTNDNLQRIEGYTSNGYILVHSKGTTLANGTYKLVSGGSELANNTDISGYTIHVRVTYFPVLL